MKEEYMKQDDKDKMIHRLGGYTQKDLADIIIASVNLGMMCKINKEQAQKTNKETIKL